MSSSTAKIVVGLAGLTLLRNAPRFGLRLSRIALTRFGGRTKVLIPPIF